LQRLRRRQDFLAAAKARSVAMPGLILQGRDRRDGLPPRIGFTVTKKLGGAVIRNRIRRRLREAARLTLPGLVQEGFDYVVIGRGGTGARKFIDLQEDLRLGLQRLHGAAKVEA
jgi:ribonuclease P protein component